MTKIAELHYNGNIYKFPVVQGSENEAAIDITHLRNEAGLITLDPGFKNTGATESSITFLNGEEGILRYRGYAIEDLAAESTFLEVAYLLIYGDLPNLDQLQEFEQEISTHALVHEDVKSILDGFPSKSHPMGVLSSLVSSLTAFYPKSLDPNRSKEEINGTIIRALAKLPTLAAWSFKNRKRQPVIYPDNSLGYCENFIRMMFSLPTVNYDVNPVVAKALDKLLILHADHEQNCSTSTVRMVGSSGANLFGSVAAGVSALWGPLHGGANVAVVEMLETIINEKLSVKDFVKDVKDKKNGIKLMGFGHRVYKNFDPRATIIREECETVLGKLHKKDELLEVAEELEKAALEEDYFIERKLYPNVDFYSGVILRALGIPTSMFTVMFAIGRMPGWIAQWYEDRFITRGRIQRPRQGYTGPTEQEYVPIELRN